MAQTSDYEKQLRETTRLVAQCRAQGLGSGLSEPQRRARTTLAGPDILDYLQNARSQGIRNILVSPLGFLSDHLEVLYDLDTEAAGLARQLGIRMIRAATVASSCVRKHGLQAHSRAEFFLANPGWRLAILALVMIIAGSIAAR